jgi:SAM-dependent methyltransferase
VRFSDRADDYAKYRPSYPEAAIDAILSGLGPPETLRAGDIGAGTGISARLLAARGVETIAIEPNSAMRDAAAPAPCLQFRDGTAEATGLAAGALDLVLCAQAFHWFQAEAALAEFGRILRAAGCLALVWNRRSREDAITLAYRQALLDIGGESQAEQNEFDRQLVARSGMFSGVRRLTFPNQQVLDERALIGRAMSASNVPKSGPHAVRLLELLHDLHARYADAAGRVTLVYETEVNLAERL